MNKIKRDIPRKIIFETNINPYAYGSVIVSFGNTKVHITASVEESVPPFLKNKGKGWITAEYNMLPASTNTRSRRERSKVSGRTQEIQRLIGRSLRAVVDLEKLGERSIIFDCDVLIADGGTRTTSISGSFVALSLTIDKLIKEGLLKDNPIKHHLAAISVGILADGGIVADLNYEEDSNCMTDMNIVMTGDGQFVEIQGTAEERPFSREDNDAMLLCAHSAISRIIIKQKEVLK